MDRELNILVISSFVKFYNTLEPILRKCGFSEVYFAVSISDAQRILLTKDVSAIVFNSPVSDGFGLDFAIRCSAEKNQAVLIFVKKELYELTAEKAAGYGIATLMKPNSPDTVSQSLILLHSTAKKLSTLKTESDTSTAKAQELKYISTAKVLLISSLGMTEEQAHKYIERRAMEARKTRKEIAQSIINSYRN